MMNLPLTAPRSSSKDLLEEYCAETPRPLPEFRLYKPRSGHPDWIRLMAEARELADKLRPNLEKPQHRLQSFKRQALSAKTAAENWRINRRLHKEGREDYLPFVLQWTALRTCNFVCTYCDDHRGRKYPELSNEGVLDTEGALKLLRIMRTRAPSMYFAGGEPTLRKDLPTLTRAARDLNYYPIIVNTNGSMIARNLSKPAWRSWLADTDNVIVSLDGLDLRSLKDIWNYRRPQDVLRNLLLLRELADEMNFKLMINAVILPDALETASDLLDLACDLGIWLLVVPVNIGPTIDTSLQKNPAYLALAKRILDRKRAGYPIGGSMRLNRQLLFSEKLNCKSALKPHVDYDGRLAWPCKASVNVEPEFISVLDFENVDQLYEHASRRISPKGFHGPAINQCGAHCNWAQNYMTDAYVHGLVNPLSVIGEIREFVFQR